jgi:hypothetical protein
VRDSVATKSEDTAPSTIESDDDVSGFERRLGCNARPQASI